MVVHGFEQFHFDLRLIEKRLLILDDLDCYVTLINLVKRLDHLAERAFADE